MWSFDFLRRPRTLLRVGRIRIEKWDVDAGTWTLREQWPLAAVHEGSIAELEQPLKKALKSATSKSVTLLLESAWSPVLLLEVNPESAAHRVVQQQASLRMKHRYAHLSPDDDWQIEMLYRAGDGAAVAFGIPSRLMAQIFEWASECQAQLATVESAFGWWSERCARRSGGPKAWWLGIQEQDRSLLARCTRRRILDVHPGLPADLDARGWVSAIDHESFRQCLAMSSNRANREALWIGHWGSGDSTVVDGFSMTSVGAVE